MLRQIQSKATTSIGVVHEDNVGAVIVAGIAHAYQLFAAKPQARHLMPLAEWTDRVPMSGE